MAKRRAAEEGRPLSDLIQDALVQYLRKDAATRPMKIPPDELRHVLEEERVGSMNLEELR